ncbi:hypothetical protein L1285_03035 [Pseudoalteromonas sp. DL2-H2.2]|uniref:hypothetical protein n=1 Tax=Pseudoalteromonas sp. DL2-H2.2 TaxID=2908889 RepID=UPI001F4395B3|nr:hypothetical protein [Pseudoalteromonas sp. DL2-H2.2]MCF2907314.1 hypothetical protein [Pseudoalteromonas sp. DL2-H2.2]
MKAKYLMINVLCFMLGFLVAAVLLHKEVPQHYTPVGDIESPDTILIPQAEERSLPFNTAQPTPEKRLYTSASPIPPELKGEPENKDEDKARLLSIAQDIGLDSGSYPDLAGYENQDITRLIEQHLLTNLRASQGDVYAQFDEVEHYLEAMPQIASVQFFTDLLAQAEHKGALSQSFAIHLMAQSVEQFEPGTEPLSQMQDIVATARHSESELVRLSALESLATMSADQAQLKHQLEQFQADESTVIQAKITLLNYHMALADKLNNH